MSQYKFSHPAKQKYLLHFSDHSNIHHGTFAHPPSLLCQVHAFYCFSTGQHTFFYFSTHILLSHGVHYLQISQCRHSHLKSKVYLCLFCIHFSTLLRTSPHRPILQPRTHAAYHFSTALSISTQRNEYKLHNHWPDHSPSTLHKYLHQNDIMFHNHSFGCSSILHHKYYYR